jgi:hypothetical protein
MNIPIFSQKHCDLPTSPEPLKKRESVPIITTLDCCSDDLPVRTTPNTSPPPSTDDISQLDCCSTGTLMNSASNIVPPQNAEDIGKLDCCTPEPASTASPSGLTILDADTDPNAPFTRSQSTKICRTAALNIAQSFHTLPYPSPLVSSTSLSPLPRAMPVFACCAMQCSYALLMLCHKATKSNNYPDDNIVVQGYMSHLQQALQVIVNALENYAGAYEALDGMRGKTSIVDILV